MGDWGNTLYVVSQIFVVFAGIAVAASYLVKKKRNSKLFCMLIANTFLGIAFGLLSAFVGLGMCSIAILRDSVSYFLDKKKTEEEKSKTTKTDLALLFVWLSAMLIVTAFTFTHPITWLGFFGTATFTVSIVQKNKMVYNILGLAVESFWLGYNICINNLMGVIVESLLFIPIIFGIITYSTYLKKQNQKAIEVKRELCYNITDESAKDK